MPAYLLTPPTEEPVSLADAKLLLRVEHEADDALIGALVEAARAEVERATRRVLVTQTWRVALDRWPASGRIVSPVNPLKTLDAVRVLAADGTSMALDPEAFVLDTASRPGAIAFDRAKVVEPGRAIAGIELDVTAGHGDADEVPAPLVQAMRHLIARAYERREHVSADALPDTVARLIAPYRILSL